MAILQHRSFSQDTGDLAGQTTRQNRINCYAAAISLLASILLLTACSQDERSAFEAFQDCNDNIKSAKDEEGALACFTDSARQEIRDDRYGDIAPWLEMFRSKRPDAPRLFREVEVEDKTQLLIIEGDGPGYTRHIVQMQRMSGEWRIADWDSILMGLIRDDPDAPIDMSLDFTGAVEWTSDDLVISVGTRCTVSISHVFDVANVNFPAKCDLLTEPGQYSAAEFLDPDAGRPVYVSVEGSPNIGIDRSKDALLTVSAAPPGKISGAFVIEVAHPDGDYTVNGAYENIPFDGGGIQ